MAAPTPSARTDPRTVGIMLEDGFSVKVTLASNPEIEFFEKTVTPPSVDGGDPISTTTQFNDAWRTKAARSLKEMGDIEITAGYDPDVYNQVILRINVATTITITFPDLSTIAFYGYLKAFEPQSMEEGNEVEANITIVCTNWDFINNVEEPPAVAETAGT